LEKKLNKSNFLVIPIVAFALIPVVHDSLGIPKLIALVIGTIYIIAGSTYKKLNFNAFLYIPPLLVIIYLFIQIINPIDFSKFLLGSYSRNGGFIAILCLTIIFLLIATNSDFEVKNYLYLLNLTINLLAVYSLLEIFNLLPYKSLTDFGGKIILTLANPNFASAFLGIAVTFKLFYAKSKNRIKLLEIPVIFYLLYLLYQTGSIQGYFVLTTGCIFFLIMLGKKSQYISVKRFILTSCTIFPIVLILIFLNSKRLIDFLIDSGSARFRINYWNISFNIWKDHKFFGVGIDNLSSYATKYRSEQMVMQEGIFTIPDRSHNVFIDHFVNGGLLAGITWLTFVLGVSFIAVRMLYKRSYQDLTKEYFLIVSIWFGYVTQSLVSVDHLFLTLLGYISAGFIINCYQKKNYNYIEFSIKKFSRFIKLVQFGLLAILFFCLTILYSERQAFLFFKDRSPEHLDKFYNVRFFHPNTFEKVTIEISRSKDFSLAYKFAQKLEKHTLNNHQSKYVQSVYYESIKDYKTARDLMFEAHRLDKFNPLYTVGLALFEYRLGNKNLAIEYLNETQRLNPNQQGFKEIADFIYSNL
jgi:O-antigen ligase